MIRYNLLFVLVFFSVSVHAGVINTSDLELVSSFDTEGLYNLNGLTTWNGEPLSPTNMPSDAQRRLEATINFYSDPGSSNNVLFVQVDDVITTVGAFWFGTAFVNVSQTGVKFTLPTFSGTQLGAPSFDDQFANPGQELRFGPPTGSSTPIATTPGYGISNTPSGEFAIATTGGADYAFTSLGNISNAVRIFGGGVFQLTFDPSVNVLIDIDYASMTAASLYGLGNQEIEGVQAFSRPPDVVPEPTSLAIFGFGALGMAGMGRRRKKKPQ